MDVPPARLWEDAGLAFSGDARRGLFEIPEARGRRPRLTGHPGLGLTDFLRMLDCQGKP
jgi:hypothetical protein